MVNNLAKPTPQENTTKTGDTFHFDDKNLATRIGMDAFPSIPDYEGIQKNIMDRPSVGGEL